MKQYGGNYTSACEIIDALRSENERYKTALVRIANGRCASDSDSVAQDALYPDNYDTLIPDEYKSGQLSIDGIPVYIVKNGVPDNYPQWGFLSVEDAEQVARLLSIAVQSALNGGK
jgi:hypothetical protein